MLRLVDLSLDIYDKAPTFWPDPKTAVLPHLKIENLNYNITQLIMSTHLGTHLDAPYHFFDDGLTVENLEQAWERADVRKGNHGGRAARAALRMIEIKRHFHLFPR